MEDTLAAIRTKNVGPGQKMEVWLFSADNGYSTANVIKETMIPVTDAPSWGFFSLFSDGDVMAVRTRNADDGKITVYVLTADSQYTEYDVVAPTPIPVSDAPNWVFRSIDGDRDLVGIRTRNTGTSQVKIYILSRGSNYTEYMVDAVDLPIPLSEADDYLYFMVKRDLLCFRVKNTRNVEAMVLTAASNYQALRFWTVTPVPVTEAANCIFTHWYSENPARLVRANFAQLIKVQSGNPSVEVILMSGFNIDGYRYNARGTITSGLLSVWSPDFIFAGN